MQVFPDMINSFSNCTVRTWKAGSGSEAVLVLMLKQRRGGAGVEEGTHDIHGSETVSIIPGAPGARACRLIQTHAGFPQSVLLGSWSFAASPETTL